MKSKDGLGAAWAPLSFHLYGHWLRMSLVFALPFTTPFPLFQPITGSWEFVFRKEVLAKSFGCLASTSGKQWTTSKVSQARRSKVPVEFFFYLCCMSMSLNPISNMKSSWPRLCAICAWSLWLYRDTNKKCKKKHAPKTIWNDMKWHVQATIPTSSSAAIFVGPKQGTPGRWSPRPSRPSPLVGTLAPLAFKASAKPAQSGASGPTKTRATFFSSNLDSDWLNHDWTWYLHGTYHQTEVKWWKGFYFQSIEQPFWRLNHFDMHFIKLKLLCCSSEGSYITVTNGQVGHSLLWTGCHVIAP